MAKVAKKKKIIQLQWTPLQREMAAKAREGKTSDDLVEEGYTRSLVSKILNAIKSGQKLPEHKLRSARQQYG